MSRAILLAMFGLGMGELIVLAVVALLVLGPDRLPKAARSLGQGIRGFRKQTKELQTMIDRDTDIGDAVRELRSALRDEPSGPRPWKPPQTGSATPTPADGDKSDGTTGADDDEHHSDPDSADHPAPEDADGTTPEPTTGPVIKAAAGSVARGTPSVPAPSDPSDDSGAAQSS